MIDATFYQNKEVKGRDMSEIPHPFVEESIAIFRDLPIQEKEKIIFKKNPIKKNYKIKKINMVINLLMKKDFMFNYRFKKNYF